MHAFLQPALSCCIYIQVLYIWQFGTTIYPYSCTCVNAYAWDFKCLLHAMGPGIKQNPNKSRSPRYNIYLSTRVYQVLHQPLCCISSVHYHSRMQSLPETMQPTQYGIFISLISTCYVWVLSILVHDLLIPTLQGVRTGVYVRANCTPCIMMFISVNLHVRNDTNV